MSQRSNNRQTTRSLDFSSREKHDQELGADQYRNRINVDRIMLERQIATPIFERDRVGEITGDQVDPVDRCEQGMPSRSAYIVKRAQYDNNTHLDFDLYDAVDTNDNDVRYDDNASGDFAGLDESM